MDGETEGNSSQIFCLAWVKRNAAKLIPEKVQLSPEELQEIINNKPDENVDENDWTDITDDEYEGIENSISSEPERENGEGENGKEAKASDDDDYDDLKEYDMDNYDEEDGNLTQSVTGFVMFADNKHDPYVTKKDENDEDEDSEGEVEEKSSLNLQEDDNLLVCARCSQQLSSLETYVYNHKNKDFYVHHDIPLSSPPLCMQWIGFDPGSASESNNKGNLLAVGNLNSTIDIWDLDILNTLEPIFTIGKAKKMKKKRQTQFYHTDAVLDMAWSEQIRDKLASASVDKTVALWDLEFGIATTVFRDHQNKVQTIEWQPNSAECLLSGAFDGNVMILDARTKKRAAVWSLDGEIERLAWNPVLEDYFVAATESGYIYYVDSRKQDSYLHKWKAHDGPVPGLAISCQQGKDSLLYTASSDKLIKLWNLNEDGSDLVHQRNMKMGMVHCIQLNPDETSVLAVGGERDGVKLWNVSKTQEVANYFQGPDPQLEMEAGDDTLHPLGGEGVEEAEVLNYLKGEDYIDEEKIKRIQAEEKKNSKTVKGNQTNTKKRKRKKKNKVAVATD